MVWGLECLNDPESYPCQTGQRVETRLRVITGPPGWGLVTGLITQSWKKIDVMETATEEPKTTGVNGLLELFTTYDLVVGGTLFPYRDIHKMTWYSPNGRTKIR